MSDFSETTIKDIENDIHGIAQKIEAWFHKHFSHVTPVLPIMRCSPLPRKT